MQRQQPTENRSGISPMQAVYDMHQKFYDYIQSGEDIPEADLKDYQTICVHFANAKGDDFQKFRNLLTSISLDFAGKKDANDKVRTQLIKIALETVVTFPPIIKLSLVHLLPMDFDIDPFRAYYLRQIFLELIKKGNEKKFTTSEQTVTAKIKQNRTAEQILLVIYDYLNLTPLQTASKETINLQVNMLKMVLSIDGKETDIPESIRSQHINLSASNLERTTYLKNQSLFYLRKKLLTSSVRNQPRIFRMTALDDNTQFSLMREKVLIEKWRSYLHTLTKYLGKNDVKSSFDLEKFKQTIAQAIEENDCMKLFPPLFTLQNSAKTEALEELAHEIRVQLGNNAEPNQIISELSDKIFADRKEVTETFEKIKIIYDDISIKINQWTKANWSPTRIAAIKNILKSFFDDIVSFIPIIESAKKGEDIPPKLIAILKKRLEFIKDFVEHNKAYNSLLKETANYKSSSTNLFDQAHAYFYDLAIEDRSREVTFYYTRACFLERAEKALLKGSDTHNKNKLFLNAIRESKNLDDIYLHVYEYLSLNQRSDELETRRILSALRSTLILDLPESETGIVKANLPTNSDPDKTTYILDAMTRKFSHLSHKVKLYERLLDITLGKEDQLFKAWKNILINIANNLKITDFTQTRLDNFFRFFNPVDVKQLQSNLLNADNLSSLFSAILETWQFCVRNPQLQARLKHIGQKILRQEMPSLEDLAIYSETPSKPVKSVQEIATSDLEIKQKSLAKQNELIAAIVDEISGMEKRGFLTSHQRNFLEQQKKFAQGCESKAATDEVFTALLNCQNETQSLRELVRERITTFTESMKNLNQQIDELRRRNLPSDEQTRLDQIKEALRNLVQNHNGDMTLIRQFGNELTFMQLIHLPTPSPLEGLSLFPPAKIKDQKLEATCGVESKQEVGLTV